MIGGYCKKCKTESEGGACATCGARFPPKALRDTWRSPRAPVSDPLVWKSVMTVLLSACGITLVVALGCEAIWEGIDAMSGLLMRGTLLPWLIGYIILVPLLVLCVLMAQGTEEICYVLDDKGAHMQTWINPSRAACLARLRPYDPQSFALRPGDQTPMALMSERHIAWTDVQRVEEQPRKRRILLYRPASFMTMALRLPQEEFEEAARFIASKTKHLK